MARTKKDKRNVPKRNSRIDPRLAALTEDQDVREWFVRLVGRRMEGLTPVIMVSVNEHNEATWETTLPANVARELLDEVLCDDPSVPNGAIKFC